MAGEVSPTVAPEIAPVAPAADIPAAVAPAVESTPAAVVETPAPVVEPAPAAEPTPAPAAEPVAPAEAPAPPAEAPADGEKPEGEKPPVEAAPAAPKYTEFKLPEGMAIAPEQNSAFANLLGKYNLTQEAGQELMDFGGSIIKQTQERMVQTQQDVFADTRRNFVKDFEKFAGNRRDTMLNDAKFAITELVKDKAQRTELWSVLSFTGAGDHKAVISAFANAGKRLRERNAPGPSLPQNGAKSGSPADRRYGGNQKN